MTTDFQGGARTLILVSRADWLPESTPGGFVMQSESDAVAQVRAAAESGLEAVILFQPGATASGECVVVSDHINLTGANPLVGPNVAAWGVRFPDMTEPYPMRGRLAGLVAGSPQPGEAETGGAEAFSTDGVTADIPTEPRAADLLAAKALGAEAVTSGLAAPVIAANHCGLQVGAVVIPPGADGRAVVTRALGLVAG